MQLQWIILRNIISLWIIALYVELRFVYLFVLEHKVEFNLPSILYFLYYLVRGQAGRNVL